MAALKSALLATLMLRPRIADAQTTQFSYQGKLADNGSPVNGSYDFQFKLFNAREVTVIDELRKCYKCGYQTVELLRVCPKCGRRLLSVKQVRRLGWVQLILGLFIVGLMGTITFALAPSLLHPGVPERGEWFTGTAEQGLSTVGLFGLLALMATSASGRPIRYRN